jgi:hypothetical protein
VSGETSRLWLLATKSESFQVERTDLPLATHG